MRIFKRIFVISFIAIMVAGGANANIASTAYVDKEVGTKLSAITDSTSGTGNVVTEVTANGDTVTVKKEITAENVANKTDTISAASDASNTKYPSEKAVADALAGKANVGDVSITVDSTLSSTSTNPVQNKVINAALNTKANTDDLASVATSGSYNDLTDKPTIPSAYSLPVATSTALGGVKSAGDITVAGDGTVTVNSATKATQDANGNNIVNTYATKAQINELDSVSSGTGAVVTNVSQADGKVTVTKGNIQVPVGSASATTYANIWIEY